MTDDNDRNGSPPKCRRTVATLLAVSAVLALVGVLILTDVGQILRIGKPIVVAYFRTHMAFMGLSVLLFAAAVVVNRRNRVLRPWLMAVIGVFLVACFVSTKYAAPYLMFPSQHRDAVYVTIAEADAEAYLEPDDTVYVVNRGGVARAFPQRYIWQPHIFGGDYGGEQVVLTYCVMTNLPVAYRDDFDGEPMNLKVLAQTNNNLLMWDRTSGEIIQQITNTAEFSQRRLEPLPVLEMSWASFRTLFPSGTVLHNPFTNPIERSMDALMPLEDVHAGDAWMFKTVDTSDTRLPSKEQIIGLREGHEAVAYTRGFLREAGVVNTRVGDRPVAIAHLPEHDVVVAFDRTRDGTEFEVTEVDLFGDTPDHGRLEPVFIYNGVLWAVWLHYFPETELVQ